LIQTFPLIVSDRPLSVIAPLALTLTLCVDILNEYIYFIFTNTAVDD